MDSFICAYTDSPSQNYFFETIAWIGICLVTRSFGTLLFTILGTGQMITWANQKEKRYRTDFGDKYKAKKYPILPGLPYPGGKGKTAKK